MKTNIRLLQCAFCSLFLCVCLFYEHSFLYYLREVLKCLKQLSKIKISENGAIKKSKIILG